MKFIKTPVIWGFVLPRVQSNSFTTKFKGLGENFIVKVNSLNKMPTKNQSLKFFPVHKSIRHAVLKILSFTWRKRAWEKVMTFWSTLKRKFTNCNALHLLKRRLPHHSIHREALHSGYLRIKLLILIITGAVILLLLLLLCELGISLLSWKDFAGTICLRWCHVRTGGGRSLHGPKLTQKLMPGLGGAQQFSGGPGIGLAFTQQVLVRLWRAKIKKHSIAQDMLRRDGNMIQATKLKAVLEPGTGENSRAKAGPRHEVGELLGPRLDTGQERQAQDGHKPKILVCAVLYVVSP